MAPASIKDLAKAVDGRLKLWLVLLNKFINERNPREKQMIIVLGLIGILFFDYWILIHPVIKTYAQVISQYSALETELRGLKDDQKNKKFIEKMWDKEKEDLKTTEKRFVGPNEMPALLENLSKLALDSGVNVMSLEPLESSNKNAKKGTAAPYSSVSIRMSAVGGTHEIGKFLSWLENNPTFIKVTDIKISPNPADDRRHILELQIEVTRMEALS